MLKIRWDIYKYIDNKEYEKAEELIDKYKTIVLNKPLHMQYAYLVQCEVYHKTNKSIEECMKVLECGLNCTSKDIKKLDIKNMFFCRMELYII